MTDKRKNNSRKGQDNYLVVPKRSWAKKCTKFSFAQPADPTGETERRLRRTLETDKRIRYAFARGNNSHLLGYVELKLALRKKNIIDYFDVEPHRSFCRDTDEAAIKTLKNPYFLLSVGTPAHRGGRLCKRAWLAERAEKTRLAEAAKTAKAERAKAFEEFLKGYAPKKHNVNKVLGYTRKRK